MSVDRWSRPPSLRLAEDRQAVLPVDLGPVVSPPENPQHWQTPERLLSFVRVIGPIGLDVCTSEENPVRARRFFCADGLKRPWSVRSGETVFCNPPFAECALWASRAVRTRLGRGHGIWCVFPLRPHRVWWEQWVTFGSEVVAVVREPVRFVGAESHAPWPVAIVGYGRATVQSALAAASEVGLPISVLVRGGGSSGPRPQSSRLARGPVMFPRVGDRAGLREAL